MHNALSTILSLAGLQHSLTTREVPCLINVIG